MHSYQLKLDIFSVCCASLTTAVRECEMYLGHFYDRNFSVTASWW